MKYVTLKIKDGGSNSVEVKFGEGNFTYSEKRNINYVLNRGRLTNATIREGDEVPIDISFQGVWEYVTSRSADSAGEITIKDALTKSGKASGWTSSSADPCEPYAVDLEIVYDPGSCGDSETLLFSDFRYESIDFDMKAATVSVTGKALAYTASKST